MYSKSMFGLNKNGTYKVWNIGVFHVHGGDHEKDGAAFTITHGSEGGKLTSKTEYVNEGKQGRTPYEQAVLQAESRFKKQYDKNYRETKEELNDIPLLAMLSKDHTKDGKDKTVEDGVFTSDKLDGIRLTASCKLAEGVKEVNLKSRTGQPLSIPHIEAQLLEVMLVGEVFDGEAYVHGPVLQDINSAVQRTDTQAKVDAAQRKYAKAVGDDRIEKAYAELQNALLIHDLRPRLQFHVFDVVELEVPFFERLELLREVGKRFEGYSALVEVNYREAHSIEELTEQLHDCINRGYEGIMYRTKDGVYESGKRSGGLFKFKLFFDEEFMINGTHKDKQGYVVFELLNNLNDETFDCVMGDYTWRLAVADDDFNGQYMTVKFQARNKGTLIPQFGTGKDIRKGTVVDGVFIPSM